jgi:hypothetical protein
MPMVDDDCKCCEENARHIGGILRNAKSIGSIINNIQFLISNSRMDEDLAYQKEQMGYEIEEMKRHAESLGEAGYQYASANVKIIEKIALGVFDLKPGWKPEGNADWDHRISKVNKEAAWTALEMLGNQSICQCKK